MDQRNHLPEQYLGIALVAGKYKIHCPALAFDLPMQSGILYSCNMGKSGLPDIYTQSPRTTGPRTEGVVYIR